MNIELQPSPGHALLVRRGPLAVLCPPRWSGTTDDVTRLVAETAAAGGDGKDLVRQLADFLLGCDGDPPVCAVGAVRDGGTAVLTTGAAAATVTVGEQEVIIGDTGPYGLAWRIFPAGTALRVRATLSASATVDRVADDAAMSLEDGVVRAGGFVLRQGAASSTAPTAPDAAEVPVVAAAPETTAVPTPVLDTGSVAGVTCVRGHLNDPQAPFCAVCGLAAGATPRPRRRAARPPVGTLLLDDGRQIPVDKNIVIGAAPTPGAPEEVAVAVPGAGVHAMHVRIMLQDWQVTATPLGPGPTYLCIPGTVGWAALSPVVPTVVWPGAVLAMGSRQVRFDSHRRLTGRLPTGRAA